MPVTKPCIDDPRATGCTSAEAEELGVLFLTGEKPCLKFASREALPAGFDLSDYRGYLARLLVLGGVLVAAILLDHLSAGRPTFAYLMLAGVLVVCLALVLGPQARSTTARLVIPLFDLAWVMFAMYLTDGLQSFLLPLLYIIVATAAIRGTHWEIGTTLAGAVTGIFVLASLDPSRQDVSLAAAQAVLLAAGALGVRLMAGTEQEARAGEQQRANDQFYNQILTQTTDAVFLLEPETWVVQSANPAATGLFNGNGDPLTGQPLADILRLTDEAFLETCRQQLQEQGRVRHALTHGRQPDGQLLPLRLHITPYQPAGGTQLLQVVVNREPASSAAAPEKLADVQAPPVAARPDEFITHYLPSLTHELNNHLAAIRMTAELAETLGKTPNWSQIQEQVDHCQEVLQTVVMQIMRAGSAASLGEEIPTSEVRSLVEHVLVLTRPQIMTAGATLHIALPEDPVTVRGFSYDLQEALVRVLLHAAGSMKQQELPRTISLTAEVKGNFAELQVSDLGPGLTASELALLNGRRRPLSGPEDRKWDVVRDSVCRFGGELEVDNGLHGGARYHLRLALAEDD
jgi:signal transduction histidine kinase